MIDKKLFWWNSGVGNNQYVQSVINASITNGDTQPSPAIIAQLNILFNTYFTPTIMAKAEMIKMYALNNALLENFSLWNYANPANFKSVKVLSPVYGTTGWTSDGSGYLNGVIKLNRRAGVEADFSSLCYIISTSTVTTAQGAYGGKSTNTYLLMRPYVTGAQSQFYGMCAVGDTVNLGSSTNAGGMYSLSNASATTYEASRDASFTAAKNVLAPVGTTSIFDCAWSNSGTPIEFMTKAPVSFRFEGYALTRAEIASIKTGLEAFYTAIGL